MRVRLNGEWREATEGESVADLVAQLGLRPEQVAVELNRKLVARTAREAALLTDGDELELVTMVGGG